MPRLEEDIRLLLIHYFRDTLGLPNWQYVVENQIKSGLKWTVKNLDKYVSLKESKMILDVGCGFGDFIIGLAQVPHQRIIGIEPDLEWAFLAKQRNEDSKASILCAMGESIPYPDGTFDGIFCNQVLEHVEDLHQVLSEIWRVCSPGGWIYLAGPNYLLPYDPHYRLPFIPWLPKNVSVKILNYLRRNPSYLQCCITFINPFKVLHIFKRMKVFQIQNLFLDYLKNPEQIASLKLRRIISLFKWVPWPSWLAYAISPTFIMLIRKPINAIAS